MSTQSTASAVVERPNNISEAQLAANRANAQLSVGPKTSAGKAIASLNALKTGLTGRTILLPTDDVAIYQQHIARIFKKYAPTTDDEKAIVQSIADTEWRLLRITPLEEGFYALGRQKLADQFAETDPQEREALIRTETFNLYRKEFNNLALQERRLRNHRKDDIAELQALRFEAQKEKASRSADRHRQTLRAATLLANAAQLKEKVTFAEFGFDFSEAELAAYEKLRQRQHRLTGVITAVDFDAFLAEYRATSPKKEAQAAA